MSRFQDASKAPLAVAGILAAPLFFVGLMAFSLKLDKPSHELNAKGRLVLADPTKGTVTTIYLCAIGVSLGVVLVGALAMLLRTRFASAVPAIAGIVATVLLLIPLDTWATEHTNRFPLGFDNIPKSSPQDLFLRGQWEASAKTTADQIGLATIGIAVAALLILVVLEIRHRRGRDGAAVAPPPIDLDTGGAPGVTG